MGNYIDSCLKLFEEKTRKCVLEFFEEESVPFSKDEEEVLCSKIRKCAEGYFAGKKSPHGLDSEEQNYACDICAIIEDILEEKYITIPDDSREDYGEDEEDQARLFGDAYYEMEDSIASLFEEVKGDLNRKASLEEQVAVASEGRSEKVYSETVVDLNR